MTSKDDSHEALNERFEALSDATRETGSMVDQFTSSLGDFRAQMVYTDREVANLSRSFGRGLRTAFDAAILDGARLSDVLRTVGQGMLTASYSAAMRPVQNAVGGALSKGLNSVFSGLVPFKDGGSFAQGKVVPFANGGIVSHPTTFAMRNGHGLMGEAGPEAIMPLSRGADGKLGVRAEGAARPVTVNMNIRPRRCSMR